MNSTGRPWLDLVLAIVGSGTGSFGLGLYVGYRWGRRRVITGRHVAGEKRVIRPDEAPPLDD